MKSRLSRKKYRRNFRREEILRLINQLKNIITEEGISAGDPLYSLDELKTVAEVEKFGCCWLALKITDENVVEFMLVQFCISDLDESNTRVSVVFHGLGFTAPLRKCRHIYWGPKNDGYTFCLPAIEVRWALEKLKKYFDFR